MELYYRAVTRLRMADPICICRVCKISGDAGSMDPHHPLGRVGDNLFNFFMVHRNCHRQIHEFPEHARKEGWLG